MYDKQYLESLETKDDVVEYAEKFGIAKRMKKQRSLSNLKKDFVMYYNSSLGSDLEETQKKYATEIDIASIVGDINSEAVDMKPINGEESIVISHPEKEDEIISAGSLEDWCKLNSISYQTALDLTIKTWLSVHRYKFKRLK